MYVNSESIHVYSLFIYMNSHTYDFVYLTCSPQYTKWFEQLQYNWSSIIPKFDMDLITSQSSQSSC